MRTSEQLDKISSALVAFHAEIENPGFSRAVEIPVKGGRVIQFSYAELASILDQYRPILARHGLTISQDSYTDARISDDYLQEDKGSAPLQVRFTVIDGVCVSRMMHSSGQWIETDPCRIPASGSDARSVGAALTYARRYSIVGALGIIAEDDNDGVVEAVTTKIEQPQKQTQQQRPLSHQLAELGIDEATISKCGLDPRANDADRRALAAALPRLRAMTATEIGADPAGALAEALAGGGR